MSRLELVEDKDKFVLVVSWWQLSFLVILSANANANMLSASRWNRGKKFTGCSWPIGCRVTKHYDWFALVNKYLRGKVMRTSPTLTEIWPISDRFFKQKILLHHWALLYSVRFRKSSRTNCPNWSANSRTSETIFGLSPRADAKLNPWTGPMPSLIRVCFAHLCCWFTCLWKTYAPRSVTIAVRIKL